MFRLTITDALGTQEFCSGRTDILIGRREGADLRIAEKAASRNHCVLRMEAGRAFLVDLGSVNGTLVGGQKIERVEIAKGGAFRIGATEFRVEEFAGASGLTIEDEPAAPAIAPALPLLAAAAPPGLPPHGAPHPSEFAREIRAMIRKVPWYGISLVFHALLLFILSLFNAEVRRTSVQGIFATGGAEDLAPVDRGGIDAMVEPELESLQLEPEDFTPDEPTTPARKNLQSSADLGEPDDLDLPKDLGTGSSLGKRIKPIIIAKTIKDGGARLDTADLEGEQERAKEAVSRGLGDGLGMLGGLPPDQIVVVGGDFDKMEAVLDLYRIRYTLVRREDLLRDGFQRPKALCINCARKPQDDKSKKYGEKVKSLVERGTWVITSDWAVDPYLCASYPDVVQTVRSEDRQSDVVVAVQPTGAESPLLRGVFTSRQDAHWWLEESSTLIKVDSRRADVLVTSDDMLGRYGASVVVFEFQPTRHSGKVLHLLGHFYQKDGNRQGLVAMHRLILNFLRERFEGEGR